MHVQWLQMMGRATITLITLYYILFTANEKIQTYANRHSLSVANNKRMFDATTLKRRALV